MSYRRHTSAVIFQERVDLSLHGFIHFYEGWPGAHGAFTSQLMRGIDPDLASHTDLGCRMIEHVCWTLGENAVALGISVGAKAKEDFACVVDIHVGIDYDDIFGEHHLSHAPKAVHYFI